MRKIAYWIWASFICIFALTGCGQKTAGPAGVVVKAEINYRHGEERLYRCYTEPEKISQVLMSLRMQKVQGVAKEDPERLIGDVCRITLTYGDGSTGVILQRANRFRSRNFHRWQTIDETQAQKFYPMLKSLPGDISQTWVWTDTGRRYPEAA